MTGLMTGIHDRGDHFGLEVLWASYLEVAEHTQPRDKASFEQDREMEQASSYCRDLEAKVLAWSST